MIYLIVQLDKQSNVESAAFSGIPADNTAATLYINAKFNAKKRSLSALEENILKNRMYHRRTFLTPLERLQFKRNINSPLHVFQVKILDVY